VVGVKMRKILEAEIKVEGGEYDTRRSDAGN